MIGWEYSHIRSLNLNREEIISCLFCIIADKGGVSEKNKMIYSSRTDWLISQIEIYDQIWYVRHILKDGLNTAKRQKIW